MSAVVRFARKQDVKVATPVDEMLHDDEVRLRDLIDDEVGCDDQTTATAPRLYKLSAIRRVAQGRRVVLQLGRPFLRRAEASVLGDARQYRFEFSERLPAEFDPVGLQARFAVLDHCSSKAARASIRSLT